MSARVKHAGFLQKGTEISLKWFSFCACHGFLQPTCYSTNHSTQSNPSDLSSAFLRCLHAKFEHRNPGLLIAFWLMSGWNPGTSNTWNSMLHMPMFMVLQQKFKDDFFNKTMSSKIHSKLHTTVVFIHRGPAPMLEFS